MKTWVMVLGMVAGFGLMSAGVSADEKDEPFPKPDMSKAKEMFQKLDANGDGKLSLEEFAKFESMRGGEGDAPRPLGGKFGGGKLDPEKLKALKDKFGGKLTPEQLKQLKEKFKDKRPN